MCASFGFDFDNDGIMSWEDDYFGEKITEDPTVRTETIPPQAFSPSSPAMYI